MAINPKMDRKISGPTQRVPLLLVLAYMHPTPYLQNKTTRPNNVKQML